MDYTLIPQRWTNIIEDIYSDVDSDIDSDHYPSNNKIHIKLGLKRKTSYKTNINYVPLKPANEEDRQIKQEFNELFNTYIKGIPANCENLKEAVKLSYKYK